MLGWLIVMEYKYDDKITTVLEENSFVSSFIFNNININNDLIIIK